jgi:hypothetical protein
MQESAGVNALFALLSFLMLPAALLLFFGIRNWYAGIEERNEEKHRWGRMFTMFGVIFLVILGICSYFLKGSLPV